MKLKVYSYRINMFHPVSVNSITCSIQCLCANNWQLWIRFQTGKLSKDTVNASKNKAEMYVPANQILVYLHLLQTEKPLYFNFNPQAADQHILKSGLEPVGEEEKPLTGVPP